MIKTVLARALVAVGLVSSLGASAPPARAAQVLTVTSSADSGPGSLREALAGAQPGDRVAFDTQAADMITVRSTLAVPAGVTLGNATCGPVNLPAANLGADGAFVGPGPLLRLAAGAVVNNLALARVSTVAGPDLGVQIVGAGAELCGVAIGEQFDRESGAAIPEVAPFKLGLTISAGAARVRRGIIHGPLLVAAGGGASVVGDLPGGSGEANLHRAGFTGGKGVTIYGDATGAAQRVTVRDAVARSFYPPGAVVGGDDVALHPNNWVAPPQLSEVVMAVGLVQVKGVAAPHALVDLYASGADYSHLGATTAGPDGAFSLGAALPAGATKVCAALTLADPAHPGRAGSSSPLSACLAPGDGPAPEPSPTPEPSPGPAPRPAVFLPAVARP